MKFKFRGELARYNGLPKDFVGEQDADDLFYIHESLRLNTDSSTYLFTAGSAAAESGLMATHLSADDRHARVECADDAWQQAQASFIRRHENDDWSESKLASIPDRIEMHRIYVPLYHDMIEGNVREATISKTHQRLVRLGMTNMRHHDSSQADEDWGTVSTRRGIAYELGTLMTVTRLECPSFFTVPASARADHGAVYPEETHDVRLIHQSWGEILSCIPYEVKPKDVEFKDRYRSAYVRGRVELLMPSSTDPLDLVKYMDAEQRGVITPEHLAELNEITSRVLRLAQNYQTSRSIGELACNSA